MFKRVTWLSVGLLTGLATSKWVEHKARQRLARYLPAAQVEAGLEAAGRAKDAAASTVAGFRHALEGGRRAMTDREAELRRQLRLDEPGPDQAGRARVASEGTGHDGTSRAGTGRAGPGGPGLGPRLGEASSRLAPPARRGGGRHRAG